MNSTIFNAPSVSPMEAINQIKSHLGPGISQTMSTTSPKIGQSAKKSEAMKVLSARLNKYKSGEFLRSAGERADKWVAGKMSEPVDIEIGTAIILDLNDNGNVRTTAFRGRPRDRGETVTYNIDENESVSEIYEKYIDGTPGTFIGYIVDDNRGKYLKLVAVEESPKTGGGVSNGRRKYKKRRTISKRKKSKRKKTKRKKTKRNTKKKTIK